MRGVALVGIGVIDRGIRNPGLTGDWQAGRHAPSSATADAWMQIVDRHGSAWAWEIEPRPPAE